MNAPDLRLQAPFSYGENREYQIFKIWILRSKATYHFLRLLKRSKYRVQRGSPPLQDLLGFRMLLSIQEATDKLSHSKRCSFSRTSAGEFGLQALRGIQEFGSIVCQEFKQECSEHALLW